jgi:molybdopterin converting factor small subunit
MGTDMKLGQVLKSLADDQENVKVNGNTVRECLADLIRRYPATGNWIFDEQGTLISVLMLNGQILHPRDLDKKVGGVDEIFVLTAISGG